MGRGMQLAVLVTAVVGSTGGGLLALHVGDDADATASMAPRPLAPAPPSTSTPPGATAAPPSAAPPTPPPPGSAAPGGTAPAPPPVAVTPTATTATAPVPSAADAVTTQLRTILTRFAAWAPSHDGAPCPDLAALGLVAADPWGHDIELTCTDQPADQRIGARSLGPDGRPGTDDDVASWNLGAELTGLVRGARWRTARAGGPRRTAGTARPPRPTTTLAPAPPATGRTASPPAAGSGADPAATRALPPAVDAGVDDIPARR